MRRVKTIFIVAVLGVLALPAGGAGDAAAPPGTDWMACYVDAWQAECGDYRLDDALAGYHRVLAADQAPAGLRALACLRLGHVQHQAGAPAQAASYLLRLTRDFPEQVELVAAAQEELRQLREEEGRWLAARSVVDARIIYGQGEAQRSFQLGDDLGGEVPSGSSYRVELIHQGEAPAWLYLLRVELRAAPLAYTLVPDQFDQLARPVSLAPGVSFQIPRDLGWGLEALVEEAPGAVITALVLAPQPLPETALAGLGQVFMAQASESGRDFGRRPFRKAVAAAQEKLQGWSSAAQLFAHWVRVRP